MTFSPAPAATWTPERQRAFIAALADTGVVAAAARAVGMGVTSAYNLRRRPQAKSFAAAWDLVEEMAADRALHGTTTPRFYRGRFTGATHHRFETRLALAALRAVDRRASRQREKI